jgi:hypothetical protein
VVWFYETTNVRADHLNQNSTHPELARPDDVVTLFEALSEVLRLKVTILRRVLTGDCTHLGVGFSTCAEGGPMAAATKAIDDTTPSLVQFVAGGLCQSELM